MVLAHTRGLLKPDYAFGNRSVIRENLVLSCLERETQAQGFLTRGIVDAVTLPIVKAENRMEWLDRSLRYISQGVALFQFTPYDKVSKMATEMRDAGTIKKTIRAFKLLKRTDFYSRMNKVLKKHLAN